MISVTRAWLAFAAIGAGMIHLALVVDAPLPLAIAPALLGTAELGWGVAALARTTLPVPRSALAIALAAAGASLLAAALLAPSSWTAGTTPIPAPASPLLLAAALDGAVALLLAAAIMLAHRRSRLARAGTTTQGGPIAQRESIAPASASPSTSRILLSLAAIAAGALAVGAITTPALAATEAGRQARPHGEHLLPAPQSPERPPPAGGHEGH